jgi:hypothetical protein
MNIIAEESLVDEEILSPQSKYLLHINLLNSINVKLILLLSVLRVIIFDEMSFEADLV